MDILKRMTAARSAAVTCSASRHSAEVGERLVEYGKFQLDAAAAHEAGESIAATVAALWEARAEIERLRADAARLDWLADPGNQIGNVQLPTECVRAHPESMRAAIDAAMRMEV